MHEGFSSISPPCLISADQSLWLAMMVGQAPASASLDAIITTVATWMATWFTWLLQILPYFTEFMLYACTFSGVTLSTKLEIFTPGTMWSY